VARILIVDDAESDRVLEESILLRAGHEVVSAANGEEAIARYLDSGVDVVITDLEMPHVHGFELISRLRDLRPCPPVIAVSGAGAFHLDVALELGAISTLAKPIDAVLLLQAVDAALTH